MNIRICNEGDADVLNPDYCASLIARLKEEAKNGDFSAYQKVKAIRVKIFKSTEEFSNLGGYYIKDDTSKGFIPIENAKYMMYASRLFSYEIPAKEPQYKGFETHFSVVSEDCLDTAHRLAHRGLDSLLLNMANRRNPGGGVTSGAGAQEETIFRRSNLFRSLYQFASYASDYGLTKRAEQYPLDRNFGGVYSPEVTVFREDEEHGYRLMNNPFRTAVVSVASINRPALTSEGLIVPEQTPGVKNKIRTILRIALMYKHENLVLGALGCGAFRNPPKHIARLFHEVFEEREFKNQFNEVFFSILEDHNSHLGHNADGNFKPFFEEFSKQ